MFFLLFEATPRSDNPEGEEHGGAFVSCWIDRPNLAEAKRIAREMIERHGWIADEPDEAYPIDRTAYETDATGREFYEQALIDKEVIVFHVFPLVDEEE